MRVKKKIRNRVERKEYKEIIKIIDTAYKKALLFNKTDYQKKLEKVFGFC